MRCRHHMPGTRPTPASTCPLRSSAAGGRFGQVRASVTPGPTSSSPSKNSTMPAGEWLYQVAAVYSSASCLASCSSSNRAQEMTRQLARRDQRGVSGGHRARGCRVQEVQHRAEDDADRPGGVDDSPQVLVTQDGRRVTQVRVNGGHAVAGGQQRPDVR